MERNINYTLIGIIFCALSVGMIAFIFWIGRFGIDDRRLRVYKVYTQDDVSAINTSTPVKFKGINVGSVLEIGFKKGEVGVVQIDVGINKKIPITEGSELVVDSDGFAGLSYLNLKLNQKGNVIKDKDEAVLYLSKNSLSKFLDSAMDLSDDLQDILNNIKSATDKQNVEDIKSMFATLEGTKEHLDNVLISANKLLKDMDAALLRGDFNFKELVVPLLNNANGSLQILNSLLEKGNHFMDRLERDPYETLLGKRE